MASFHNPHNNPCQLSRFSFAKMPSLNNPIKKLTPRAKLHHNMHMQ
eukprot:Gb_09315 [translate_table: standard]